GSIGAEGYGSIGAEGFGSIGAELYGSIGAELYRSLLMGGADEALREAAERVTLREFGGEVMQRALVEVTSCCGNDCYYCGIRASNREARRYTLTREEIVAVCGEAYALGFRTFVLQGGEWRGMSDRWLVGVIEELRQRYTEATVTLSLGERSRGSYERLYEAGARRYLLRHETFNREHYSLLHPPQMSYDRRMECLEALREIGYAVGTGMMVGTPHQSVDHLVEDLLFIERFKPEMVGIGPFIPHHSTPFAAEAVGSVEMTLRLISIVRLMMPRVWIPSTTALATLAEDGRERGLRAGANVVMPKFTPPERQADYSLYDNK
ncbi:MAG: [FeFe] hydrogenase H-cluster radical SAM maturase HydE, partial [Rikenellaceae bacterium]